MPDSGPDDPYYRKVSLWKPFFFCLFCAFFENFLQKVLVVREKVVPLHPQMKIATELWGMV